MCLFAAKNVLCWLALTQLTSASGRRPSHGRSFARIFKRFLLSLRTQKFRERTDRRITKHLHDRKIAVEDRAHLALYPEHQQRVPAEIEEVVVYAHLIQLQ